MPARKYNPADYVGQTLGTFAVERIELEPRKNQYGTRAIAIGHCTNCGAPVRRPLTSVILNPPKYCRNCPRPLIESLKSYDYKRSAIAAEFVGKTFGCFHVESVTNERDRHNQARNIAHGHCINCGAEMSRVVTALRLSSPKYCRNCPAEFRPKRLPGWNRPADPEDYVGKTFGVMLVDYVQLERNKRGQSVSVAHGHCTKCGAKMSRGVSSLRSLPPRSCRHKVKPAP